MAKKDPKVSQLNVGLKLAKELRKEIFDFLQYNAVSVVMEETEFWYSSVSDTVDRIFKSSIRVSNEVMKPLYDMLVLAKERLGFKEPIDLYVVNNEAINACASYSFDSKTPHLIQIFSGMINTLTDEEILSILGHEIGHLIGKDAEISRLMDFVYGDSLEKTTPRFLDAKLQMLSQLNEIRCDRCGCIASGTLEPNVTSQFTLMCGVNHDRFGGGVQGILSRCSSNIEMIKDGRVQLHDSTHPDDPIRIRAMEIFCKNNDTKQMEQEMEEIIDLVRLWHKDKMDKHYADFIVSAGLMIADIDGKITDEEIEAIINNIIQYKMFPVKEFKRIAKKDIEKVFRKSVKAILEDSPFESVFLMKYVLRMMVADHHIKPAELQFAYQLSQNVFNMSKDEFSGCYADVIREFFHPRYIL